MGRALLPDVLVMIAVVRALVTHDERVDAVRSYSELWFSARGRLRRLLPTRPTMLRALPRSAAEGLVGCSDTSSTVLIFTSAKSCFAKSFSSGS